MSGKLRASEYGGTQASPAPNRNRWNKNCPAGNEKEWRKRERERVKKDGEEREAEEKECRKDGK